MKLFETNDQKKGAIGTLVVHLVLLLLFVFLGMKIPYPLPEEEGMIINFGTSETGSGEIQPQDVSEKITKPNPTPQKASKAASESVKGDTPDNVKTQNLEESANVSKNSVKSTANTTTEAEQPQRTPDASKLYPGKKKTDATSDGNTGGAGDQGKKEGSFDSNNRTGGTFGNGSSFALSGRSMLREAPVSNNFPEAGKIVVEIIVDRNGKVISARPGYKGTTISNKIQQDQAEQAALKAQFSPNPDAPERQVGYITINYAFN